MRSWPRREAGLSLPAGNNGASITIKINRRAYSPVLRKADLPADTAVPWWGNRTLHWDFA